MFLAQINTNVLLGLGLAVLMGCRRRQLHLVTRTAQLVQPIRSNRVFAVTAIIVLSMFVAASAEAKKGGPPQTPPGNIYMDFWNYAAQQQEGMITDGDGNNAIFGVAGSPSYELHDGHRWLLQHGQQGILAVRDDGSLSQLLIDDSSFGILKQPFNIPPPWVPGAGDTAISFLGYDIANDQQGVFTLPVEFDAAGTPSVPDNQVPALAWSIPKQPHNPPAEPGPAPDASSHSWSADGTQLLYGKSSHPASYLVQDLATGGTETYLGAGWYPALSPDGETVAYSLGNSLATVRSDGTGEVVLVEFRPRGQKFFGVHNPIWSPDLPDSNHLIFRLRRSRLGGPSAIEQVDDVWRINRDGSGAVNLTDRTSDNFRAWMPTAWRLDGMSAAVPEPDTVVLLGVALCGLLGCHRRPGNS